MDIEIVIAILSSTVLTSVFTGFANRRKTEVDIEDKINQMATRLIDDQRTEIDALNGHIMQLQKESKEAKAKEEHLESEINKLRTDAQTYREQAERRKQENVSLKEQIEILKTTFRGLS